MQDNANLCTRLMPIAIRLDRTLILVCFVGIVLFSSVFFFPDRVVYRRQTLPVGFHKDLCASNTDHLESLLLATNRNTSSAPADPAPTAKVALLTVTDKVSSLPHSFLASRSLYAALHNYAHVFYAHSFIPSSLPFAWNKIPALRQAFAATQAEWVWVIDHDVLVLQYTKPILYNLIASVSESAQIIIARDHNGVNAGSFLIKNTPWSHTFLNLWWNTGMNSSTSIPNMDVFFEQAVLDHLIHNDDITYSKTVFVPMKSFNCYPEYASALYRYIPGDLAVHFAGPSSRPYAPDYALVWEELMSKDGCDLYRKLLECFPIAK